MYTHLVLLSGSEDHNELSRNLFTVNMGSLLEAALLERCDGNRNILHACVSKSFPTSAHEPGEPVESQNGGTATATGALGNKLESIKGAVDALAAAVAAAAAAVRSSGKTDGSVAVYLHT